MSPDRMIFIVAGLLLASALTNATATPTKTTTPGGLTYLTGGVSIGDLVKLEDEKEKYSLWVTTAAKRSGAHLSDAAIKIFDDKNNLVLDTIIIGPWLFVDLPLGTYTVEVMFKDQKQKRTTGIHKGDHHQMLFYFESPAEVSPDWVSPFKDSPYNNK